MNAVLDFGCIINASLDTECIADIRVFLRAARPDMTGPYTLTAGFPAAPLTEEGRTLEEAGLLNAVIIQKR
jgi:UBX domain-containing protein 1